MSIFVHYKYFTFILRNSPGVTPNLRLNDLIYDCSFSNPYIITISKISKFVFSKSSLLADNFRERIYLPTDRLNAALKRRRKRRAPVRAEIKRNHQTTAFIAF